MEVRRVLFRSADIAVCAANGDVEKAIALAEAGFKQVGGLELVATLVLCGDLERRHHGGRQAAIVFLDAGGHGVEQQRCLHGLSGWDQRRSDVLDTLAPAVLVVCVLCTFLSLAASFPDCSQKSPPFFLSPTQAHPADHTPS